MTDVLVVGGGPAGRALAAACVARGLDTLLVDRAPTAPWRATYGLWHDELPPGLPQDVVAATAAGRAIARTAHDLERAYAVLDVRALRAHLDAGLTRVVTGRVLGLDRGAVVLRDGTRLLAGTVVDAGGGQAPLRRQRPPGILAEQTAYGVVVDAATAAPLVEPGSALFMDWRPDHGELGWPTFLYAVPRGRGRVLLEETSLARRPGLPIPVLRRRLAARLARHGVQVPAGAPVERVRFAVDVPRHRTPGALGFGAAAPLVHPATGFSLADALRLAPEVAAAIARGGRPAAQRVLWPASARAVHSLRRVGLEALLRMPPPEVPDFFETFFTLPRRHRWAYLGGREDLPGTAAVLAALFAHADWRLRGRLVGPAVLPAAPARPDVELAAPIG